MPKSYAPLSIVPFVAGSHYIHAGDLPEITHLEDPATTVMVDFKVTRAITIQQDAPITAAQLEMRACNVHMLLATNPQQRVVGLVTSEDLLGEKPVKIAQERQIQMNEIKVSMILTSTTKIVAIPYDALRIARVGHVIATLNHARQHYALVVEQDTATQNQIIRGVFSLLQISKKLHTDVVNKSMPARSLADLSRNLG